MSSAHYPPAPTPQSASASGSDAGSLRGGPGDFQSTRSSVSVSGTATATAGSAAAAPGTSYQDQQALLQHLLRQQQIQLQSAGPGPGPGPALDFHHHHHQQQQQADSLAARLARAGYQGQPLDLHPSPLPYAAAPASTLAPPGFPQPLSATTAAHQSQLIGFRASHAQHLPQQHHDLAQQSYLLQQSIQQQQQQQQSAQAPPQQVLVLLPSSVSISNLNLSQVVAEAEKKMQRPITFADLVLTVAATPLISGPALAAEPEPEPKKNVSTSNASTQTAESRLVSVATGSAEVSTAAKKPQQVIAHQQYLLKKQQQQQQQQCQPRSTAAPAAVPAASAASSSRASPSSWDNIDEWPESDTPFSLPSPTPTSPPPSSCPTAPAVVTNAASTIQHSRAPPALGPGLQPYTPTPAAAAAAATSSTAKNAAVDLSIVTTERPPGAGPAPFHVTIRCLRPTTSARDLLHLARGTHSLVQLFYPPYAKKNHAGRAATYFFADGKDAKEFGMGLRKRNDQGELHAKFGLTDRDLQDAYRRGVRGDGPDGDFTDRTTKLAITLSDERKRDELTKKYFAEKEMLRPAGVVDVRAWLQGGPSAANSTPAKAAAGGNNDHDDDDDDDDNAYDDGTADFAPSTWPPVVRAHYDRMLAVDDKHDALAINTQHPLSLVTSSAPAALDPSTRTVILQNVRPGVAPTDLLALARHCTSLSAIYYPPVDLKSDRVGRTAMFFLDDKMEARGFFEYLKKLIREGKGQMRKMYEVRTADEMEARTKRGMEGKKAGGMFAAWQVRMKVIFGGLGGGRDDEDEDESVQEDEDDDEVEWIGNAGGKAGSSMFAKDVWGGGEDEEEASDNADDVEQQGQIMWGAFVKSARGV